MTIDQELALYKDVAYNYAFFQTQAAQAWQEMYDLAFDLNPNSTQFADAKARFDLATERCRREMLRLED